MSFNVEKFKLEEKIRVSNLKHRGNVIAIIDDTNLPAEFICKTLDKLKKRKERNVDVLVSEMVMTHLLDGYGQRTHLLMEMLKSLDGKDRTYVSVCCSSVCTYVNGVCTCCSCNKPCEVKAVDKLNIYEIRQKTIEMLRMEDEALVKFAHTMGYTNYQGPSTLIKQNNLVISRNGGGKVIEDSGIVKDMDNMLPVDREKMIKSLESKVIEMSKVDGGNVHE